MNPVGLTRAEEEREQQPAAAQPPAQAGARSCVFTLPPDGKKCGATAAWLVTWPDPDADKSPACGDCAERIRALYRSAGRDVGLEPVGEST